MTEPFPYGELHPQLNHEGHEGCTEALRRGHCESYVSSVFAVGL